MADAFESIDPDQPTLGPRCPWCSAVLETGEEDSCPNCKAKLTGDEADIPGLTAIDPTSILRQRPVIRPRGIVGWINQDVPIEEHPEIPLAPGALDLPPADVKMEMLRLQLEAQRQQLLAEIEATPETIAAGIHGPSPLFSELPSLRDAAAEDAPGPDELAVGGDVAGDETATGTAVAEPVASEADVATEEPEPHDAADGDTPARGEDSAG